MEERRCDGSSTDSSSDSDAFDTDLEHYGTTGGQKAYDDSPFTDRRYVQETLVFPFRKMNRHEFKEKVLDKLEDPDIDHVDMHGAELSIVNFERLSAKLISSHHIVFLDISENNLGSKGGHILGGILQHSKTLRDVNAAGNHFGDSNCHQLAQGIKKSSSLVTLNLSKNELDEQAAALLASSLKVNHRITNLVLSWNYFRGKGAVYICEGVKLSKSLRVVDLSWNGLGYEGSLAVSKLLAYNRTLLELDISNNRINWQGALLISEKLKNVNSLVTLRIGGNPLTTTGCMDLITACADKHCKLLMLDVKGVPIVTEFKKAAASIEQSRPFCCVYGDVVSCHDILGRRYGRDEDPLQKLINYMRDKMLRPTELFRCLDKTVTFNTNRSEIISRLKAAGLKMQNHEYEELITQLQTLDYTEVREDEDDIIYTDMVRSVYHKLWAERMVKLNEKRREMQIEEYHKNLLDVEMKKIAEKAEAQPPIDPHAATLSAASGGRRLSESRQATSPYRPLMESRQATSLHQPLFESRQATSLHQPNTQSRQATLLYTPMVESRQATSLRRPTIGSRQATSLFRPMSVNRELVAGFKPTTASSTRSRVIFLQKDEGINSGVNAFSAGTGQSITQHSQSLSCLTNASSTSIDVNTTRKKIGKGSKTKRFKEGKKKKKKRK